MSGKSLETDVDLLTRSGGLLVPGHRSWTQKHSSRGVAEVVVLPIRAH